MTLDATAVNLARQAVEHMERMAEIAEAEAEGQWADEHDIPAGEANAYREDAKFMRTLFHLGEPA